MRSSHAESRHSALPASLQPGDLWARGRRGRDQREGQRLDAQTGGASSESMKCIMTRCAVFPRAVTIGCGRGRGLHTMGERAGARARARAGAKVRAGREGVGGWMRAIAPSLPLCGTEDTKLCCNKPCAIISVVHAFF